MPSADNRGRRQLGWEDDSHETSSPKDILPRSRLSEWRQCSTGWTTGVRKSIDKASTSSRRGFQSLKRRSRRILRSTSIVCRALRLVLTLCLGALVVVANSMRFSGIDYAGTWACTIPEIEAYCAARCQQTWIRGTFPRTCARSSRNFGLLQDSRTPILDNLFNAKSACAKDSNATISLLEQSTAKFERVADALRARKADICEQIRDLPNDLLTLYVETYRNISETTKQVRHNHNIASRALVSPLIGSASDRPKDLQSRLRSQAQLWNSQYDSLSEKLIIDKDPVSRLAGATSRLQIYLNRAIKAINDANNHPITHEGESELVELIASFQDRLKETEIFSSMLSSVRSDLSKTSSLAGRVANYAHSVYLGCVEQDLLKTKHALGEMIKALEELGNAFRNSAVYHGRFEMPEATELLNNLSRAAGSSFWD